MANRLTSIRKLFWIIVITAFSCNSHQNKEQSQRLSSAKDDTKALESKASLLYDQDRYSEAVKYFDYLIKIDSLNGEYYYKRAYSHGMLSQRVMATEDYKKAIQFRFKVNDAYYNIGVNYLFTNDSLALDNFQRCIEVDPNYSKAYWQITECKKRIAKERTMLPEKQTVSKKPQ